jgi:2'-hydroxyisoflavone reductase
VKKKILIIGGTAFVGRVLLEHLLQLGGYEITLFNRGKTNAGLFSGVVSDTWQPRNRRY